MKKFSKIFLVLLTLSLIFGTMLSVVASAATADCCDMLSVSGASHNKHSDFDSSKHTVALQPAWGTAGNMAPVSYPTVNGNTYGRFTSLGSTSGSGNKENWMVLSAYDWAVQRSGTANVGAHDYVVIDVEVGTDKYAYQDGNSVWHTAETLDAIPPEYRDKATLAFHNGMSFNINGRAADYLSSAGTSNSGEVHANMHVFTVLDSATGKWYLGSKNSYGADGGSYIELSNEIGVFDHITWVIQTVRTADSKRSTGYKLSDSKAHMFVNGEYLYSSAVVSASYDSMSPHCIKLSLPQYQDKFAICVDNVAINWYGYREMKSETNGSTTVYKYSDAGTVYSSEGYGIDDFITSGDYKSKPLYMCEDVAYGVNYTFSASRTAAEVEHLDGTVDKYANAFVASQNIQSGDFVHMYSNFIDFTPANAGIDEITFISYNNTTLKLSDEANQFYKLQHTGDRYTVRLAKEGIVIKWLDKQGDDANVLKQHILIPFVAPINTSTELQIFGEVKYTNNTAKIELLNGWIWDNKDINDVELDDIFKANSVEELNKLMEKGIKEIVLVPNFEEKDLVYAIIPADAEQSAKPDFVVDNYDFASFTNESTFMGAINKITEEDDVKVVLYSDINMINDESLTVVKGATLNLDLNGHLIDSSVKDPIIKISEGSVLNLYSTVAGGCIKSNYIITSKDIDSATVNIGEMLDEEGNVLASGDNIELAANSILALSGSDKDVANANKITINLNGGVYYTLDDEHSVLFNISEIDMVINISGASIYARTAFSHYNNLVASAEINVSDSTIKASHVISTWSKSNKMLINSSKVVGLDLSCENIILGAANYVSATDLNSGNITVSKGVNILFASEGKLPIVVADSGCRFFEDFSETFDGSFATFVDKADIAGVEIVDVIWLAPNGDEYATTYWVDGSVVDKSLVSASSFGVDESTKNEWFTKAYSTWTKADGTNDVVSATSNKFKPVAERPVESLSAVHVSLDISDTFKFNVYLPAPVSGVEFDYELVNGTGFFDKDGNLITSGVFKDVTVNETAGWTRLSVEVAADSFVADTIVVRYKVGNSYLTKYIALDILDYVNKVEAAFDGCTDEVQLVYAMLAYKLEIYKSVTGSSADVNVIIAVEDQLALHSDGCTCDEVVYVAPTENVDYSAISSAVQGFAYTLELDGSDDFAASYAFSIFFSKESAPTAVSADGVAFVAYESDEYVEFRLNLSLSKLDDVIEFTVDGTNVSYSLAKYIAETDSSLAKALYVISAAATEN